MTRTAFARVILIVLDGVGVGALPDADRYGDENANTLLHVAEAVGGLNLPNLQEMGLGNICPAPGLAPVAQPQASWGRMNELSPGKDTTTGHWELAGLETTEPFASFPNGFPAEIIDMFRRETSLDPLGNFAASGTDIIRDLGEEHLESGRPIVYTSTDSVFQIAAHEEVIPPGELYEICQKMRRALDRFMVGRIIARPFIGTCADDFTRTHRRHDFSMPPPAPTVLDLLKNQEVPVTGIGKISDIFAGRGVSRSTSIRSNADGMRQVEASLAHEEKGLLFVNLVDFDMLYGHRRDAAGFATALAEFDQWLPQLQEMMSGNDLLMVTADHGCDPTTAGTDHSREYVPLLAWHNRLAVGRELGTRSSFRDVAATLAEVFACRWPAGSSFVESLV
jgi:phosphopentomutase